MRLLIIFLLSTNLFSQSHLTLNLKLSDGNFFPFYEEVLNDNDIKNYRSITKPTFPGLLDITYNHFVGTKNYFGIGYSQEAMGFSNNPFDKDKFLYNGIYLSANRRFFNGKRFSLDAGMHYKALLFNFLNDVSLAWLIGTGETELLFDKSRPSGYHLSINYHKIGELHSVFEGMDFIGIEIYNSKDWSGVAMRLGVNGSFSDLLEWIRS